MKAHPKSPDGFTETPPPPPPVHRFEAVSSSSSFFRLTALAAASITVSPNSLRNYERSSEEIKKRINLPKQVDWRKSGAVTEVKNQRGLGNCWAFAAVAVVESLHKLVTGELVDLSVQQVTDCHSSNKQRECGGHPDVALAYIRDYGICLEKTYPFRGKYGDCDIAKAKFSPVVKIDGVCRVPYNELALQMAVASQPVVASISVNNDFDSYREGIFEKDCGENMSHTIAIVGYGTTKNGKRYWIIKNSWGTAKWGEKGYMRLLRDSKMEKYGGLCMILAYAYIPLKVAQQEDTYSKQKWVKVPMIYWNYTRKVVLTMEWMDGINLNNDVALKAASLNRKELIDKFGGSSVASAERMKEVVVLILSFPEESPVIVLISMGKTTNKLLVVCIILYILFPFSCRARCLGLENLCCAVTTLGKGGCDLATSTIGKALRLQEIQVMKLSKTLKPPMSLKLLGTYTNPMPQHQGGQVKVLEITSCLYPSGMPKFPLATPQMKSISDPSEPTTSHTMQGSNQLRNRSAKETLGLV
ncbi:hypothetical protein SSX86_022056 [Deinandra increscens subsp. villosa]|uniref:Peptidase C1A papain C-terminal domain-containing protein n=1 Tax=Deinandra increscens subsp. villosa TaxID=3103831 RepID=A0AAP0CMW7_9ASTR